MKPIEIVPPEGHQAIYKDNKVTFEAIPKGPRERFNIFLDILAFHGHTPESFKAWCEGLYPHEIGSRKEELTVAAYNGVKLTPDTYGNPPVVNFNDGQPKRFPVFDHSGGGFRFNCADSWNAYSGVGARLLFLGPESLDNLRDAVEKFLPEYKESRTL